MAIRIPPGRAGRLWLLRRLDVARRGADVLDQKRRTLLREAGTSSGAPAAAKIEWERQADVAAEWNTRALTIAGPRRLLVSALHAAVARTCRLNGGTRSASSFRRAHGCRTRCEPRFRGAGWRLQCRTRRQGSRASSAAAAVHAAARMAHPSDHRRARSDDETPDGRSSNVGSRIMKPSSRGSSCGWRRSSSRTVRARWAQERQIDGARHPRP